MYGQSKRQITCAESVKRYQNIRIVNVDEHRLHILAWNMWILFKVGEMKNNNWMVIYPDTEQR